MKKILSACLLFSALALAACGGDATSDVSTGLSEGSSTSSSASAEQPMEIIESANGLTLEKTSYTFAKAKEGDTYFLDEAAIVANADRSWSFVTSLNESYTSLKAEDETVIPSDALTLDTILDRDINGTSGSNEIVGIKVLIDRTKVNPGKTKVEIVVRPDNGSSTVMKTTKLCAEVEITAYGELMVDTYSVTFKADLSGLENEIAKVNGATEATLTISDSESIYGYSADAVNSVDLPIDGPFGELDPITFDYAVGHMYLVFVFIEAEKASDRTWLPLEADSSIDYKLEVEDNGMQSDLWVYEDNVTIEARLA